MRIVRHYSSPRPSSPAINAAARAAHRPPPDLCPATTRGTRKNHHAHLLPYAPTPRGGLCCGIGPTTVRRAHRKCHSAARAPLGVLSTAATGAAMSLLSSFSDLGLGYSIAFALGFLILVASLLLASYLCCRHAGGGDYWAGNPSGAVTPASSSGHISITVPRVLFVAEGSESPDAAYSSSAAAASSPVGLDLAAIASYPKVPFSSKAAEADAMCSICLSEYRDGDMLRVMPECKHRFHLACLDAWLRRNGSCPVCRSSPIPTPTATPLATPLSELVPLSQYAADRRRRR